MLESISENNGLGFLNAGDQKIYSVGISTGGRAEMRMVKGHEERHVTATTIDAQGAEFAKKHIQHAGLSSRIEVKLEDVSEPLPYLDGTFDYIYARLVRCCCTCTLKLNSATAFAVQI